jgi:hypothetical protein
VFRALALFAGLWGLLNLAVAVRAAREVAQKFGDLPGDPAVQAVQSAGATAVLAAVLVLGAVVAFPLGMAEVLRLCLRVEANTRAAEPTPRHAKEKRRRR